MRAGVEASAQQSQQFSPKPPPRRACAVTAVKHSAGQNVPVFFAMKSMGFWGARAGVAWALERHGRTGPLTLLRHQLVMMRPRNARIASDKGPPMSCHRWLPVLALLAILPAAAPAAPSGPDITGQYRAVRTGMVVTIGACDGNRMCGRIVALGNLPPTDANNPAPALQLCILCGTT